MNILFVLKSLEMGGVEVVTAVLANKFAKEGHHVSVFSFIGGNQKLISRFDGNINLTIGNQYSANKKNVNLLHKLIIEEQISIIINQWGLPLIPILTIRKAIRGTKAKVISVYHNAPTFNGRTQSVDQKIKICNNPINKVLLGIKRKLFEEMTRFSMKYVYSNSDQYLLLSPCYIEDFKQRIRTHNTSRVSVLTNPITINKDENHSNIHKKETEIIYVGRLDNIQKQVHRLIEVWSHLERKHRDWRLTIIGDGEERENLEKQVSDLALNKVRFVGYQDPIRYYKRASILLLTSDFEGFPLVIAECMSFGVIPIVYGSYKAVFDIIEDKKDGLILKKMKEGFSAIGMTKKIEFLINNPRIREEMAKAAIQKSKLYSIDLIYQQWMDLLKKL